MTTTSGLRRQLLCVSVVKPSEDEDEDEHEDDLLALVTPC